MNPVDIAIRNWRLTLVCLVFTLVAGALSYLEIPKEAEPDVRIPIVYVQLGLRGISPEDSERLLLRPVETKLKAVTNVKEMRSQAFEGGGYVGKGVYSPMMDCRMKSNEAKGYCPVCREALVKRIQYLSE